MKVSISRICAASSIMMLSNCNKQKFITCFYQFNRVPYYTHTLSIYDTSRNSTTVQLIRLSKFLICIRWNNTQDGHFVKFRFFHRKRIENWDTESLFHRISSNQVVYMKFIVTAYLFYRLYKIIYISQNILC